MRKMYFLITLLLFVVFSCGEKEELNPNENIPAAEFSSDKTSFFEGSSVQFIDESTNNPTSWSWEFEGGQPSTSTEQNPIVLYYTNTGEFDVKLSVSNSDGFDTEIKRKYIKYGNFDAPITNFTASQTNITVGSSVSFQDISTGNPTSWEWEFAGGNPSTSSLQNPIITYSTPGVYPVRLTATNSTGYSSKNEPILIVVTETNSIFPGEKISVNGGTFDMGESTFFAPDEMPLHSVTLNSFQIGKYEITKAQYAYFMNTIGVNEDGYYNGVQYFDATSPLTNINYENNAFTVNFLSINEPITHISWEGAKAYCEYYGGRLPSEAEWEFAAKGGNNSLDYDYSGSNSISDVAWYLNSFLHDVGLKTSNELGLYDMSGNVWEWCNDWYSDDYYQFSPSTNPIGPFSGTTKVTRGGSFDDTASSCRVANRHNTSSNTFHSTLGFRIAF